MEFEARMEGLASKVREHSEILATEEAAKTALVLPFLQALGYDVFNPEEVVPEFTCDAPSLRGEKVDYAIKVDNELSLLLECKSAAQGLSAKHSGQLFRYFGTTDAKFAILTNGAHYKFFSDFDAKNRMDDKPFFEFDFRSLRKSDIKALAKFQRAGFDIDTIVETAANLQMETAVTKAIELEMTEPSADFVRLIAKQVSDRNITSGLRAAVSRHIPNAFGSIIRDRVNARFSSAMNDVEEQEPASSSEIETTEDELEGYRIVRAIGSEVVDPSRIAIRDSQSYCAVLLDDNNRKPIARLRFNSPTTRYVGTFNDAKDETMNPVGEVRDIYKYRTAILDRLRHMISEG